MSKILSWQICILICVAICPKALADVPLTPYISLEIQGVYKRIGSPQSDANAVMAIGIRNSGPKLFDLSFKGSPGKGHRSDGSNDECYFAVPRHTRMGEAIATVDYSWFKDDGTQVLSGTADLPLQHITIEAHDCVTIDLAIKAPKAPGAYKLNARFDNSALSKLDGFNLFHVQPFILGGEESLAEQARYPHASCVISADAEVQIP